MTGRLLKIWNKNEGLFRIQSYLPSSSGWKGREKTRKSSQFLPQCSANLSAHWRKKRRKKRRHVISQRLVNVGAQGKEFSGNRLSKKLPRRWRQQPVEDEPLQRGPQPGCGSPSEGRRSRKPSGSTRLSHWDTKLHIDFIARSSLAVERELRFGKCECADEAAGSAIQFLICRLDLEILV